MYRVVGYRDLRPLDWVSGKRMPLGPGEGHTCDRCGAEHAVVYEVLEEATGKRYSVGSMCAKKQFGFDVEREARTIVKQARDEERKLVDEARQAACWRLAQDAVQEVSRLVPPEPTFDADRYPGAVAWSVGDSKALAAHGRTDEEARGVALSGWYENRVRERVPAGWDQVELLLWPEKKSKTTTSMQRKVLMLAGTMLLAGVLSQRRSL